MQWCTFGNASSSLEELDEMDREAHLHKKFANMKCQRVKVDESFVPALEDEAIEVQHLLAEPKTDHVSVDGVLCFGKENSWKQSEIEDFSYGFDCGLKRNCGVLDSDITRGQDELGLGVLDGLLDDVDEVDDIHAANDISGACEDFLLDIELAEKVSGLDCAPFGGSCLGNSSSESQSPGFSGSSNGAIGLSESSIVTIRESECKNGSLEKTVVCKLHGSSEDRCECQAPAEDNIFSTSLDLGHHDALDNDAMPFASSLSSDENEMKAVPASKGGALRRQKRLRKPTKRFIEEFSGPKSKNLIGRQEVSPAASKDRRLKVRSRNELHSVRALTYAPGEESINETITEAMPEDFDIKLSDLKLKCKIERHKNSSAASKDKHLKNRSRNELLRARELKSAPREDSLTGINTQTPFEPRPRRGRPKKHPSFSAFESDDEYTASDYEDDRVKRKSKKCRDRRKHQRMWTLSEVMKLIDGIAQCGTGRWTDIKNLQFSSSAYRTPIDLRDKWRNLLRASCAPKWKENKKEDEQTLKHAMRALPSSVLCRIQELASLHPYPRFSPGGRYIRRKKD